jgi:CxxC motif-containing protein (DUF1111 family)
MPLERRLHGARALPWILLSGAAACGTLLTEAPDDGDLLDAPLEGLTAEERAAFVAGDEAFGKPFAIAEGLGPIFNNVSCASCHSGDGRGRPENALARFGEAPGMASEVGGPQLQDRAIAGAVAEALPSGYAVSMRLPPPVFGVGLIEAIPDAEILSREDPRDGDRDGISGRANRVRTPEWVPYDTGGRPGGAVGRFSRKAQVGTLLQQVVEAYHQDMGITSDFLPEENVNPLAGASTRAADRVPDPEVAEATVRAVLDYIRFLAPPRPAEVTGELVRGEQLFGGAGCAACHTPVMRTGPHVVEALAFKDVHLYSDLLLHDMGDALADGRPDGGADGREWRTAPLWGLRVMRDFLNGDAFLLHDGRARSVEEAVLLHGGEAERARRVFEALAEADRRALLAFVETR